MTASSASGRATLRLFIAVELQKAAKDALGGLVSALREARIDGLRPIAVEGIHLTLKFLGETSADRVDPIRGVLDTVCLSMSPTMLELRGIGGFPNLSEPRILWVGLDGDLSGLGRLQSVIEEALGALGHPREGRRFTPHLTLARLREGTPRAQRQRAGEVLQRLPWAEGTPLPIEAVSLMQSILAPQGARYLQLHRGLLTGASGSRDA